MEIEKRPKTRWEFEAMSFVNLTIEQMTEVKLYSKKDLNRFVIFLIFDYNTENILLSMYSINDGSIKGKLNNISAIPEFNDSLYYYAIASGTLSSMYSKDDEFDESDFVDCKTTYEDYLEEKSKDFEMSFLNHVDRILKHENSVELVT